jgi:hypothetical protein
MKQVPNTAFVAFNTRGVPGSSSTPPATVDVAPPEFERKTLTGVCVCECESVGVCVRGV